MYEMSTEGTDRGDWGCIWNEYGWLENRAVYETSDGGVNIMSDRSVTN